MPKGVYKRTENNQRKFKQTHQSFEFKDKMSRIQMGSNNGSYKNGKYLYRAIHSWIVKNYGQPTVCEHCQTGNLTGHKIHWAIKVKPYTRNRENWLRLCSRCHGIYDRKEKLRKGDRLIA